MQVDFDITFANETPEIDAVLKIIKQNTGLEDVIYKNNSVSHPLFPNYWFGISKEQNIIHIWSIYGHMWYLLEATIAALISLGGKCEWHPTEASKKKWALIRGTYKEMKVF